MSKNTEHKKGGKSEKLGRPIPVRLPEDVKLRLKRYEESGVNTSEIIRRCVAKALPDVIDQIREELGKLAE